MNSAEKERVKFTSAIDVESGEKKGKVEVWMLEIEEMMKTTLKNLTKTALEDFKTKPRSEWVKDWPGQVILACDQVFWTAGTQQGIKDFDQGGLEEQLEHCDKNIM
jgi:dynein heavy chain, axonemal